MIVLIIIAVIAIIILMAVQSKKQSDCNYEEVCSTLPSQEPSALFRERSAADLSSGLSQQSTEEGGTPGALPGVTPGANPGVTPGALPGVTPGALPGANPGANPGVQFD